MKKTNMMPNRNNVAGKTVTPARLQDSTQRVAQMMGSAQPRRKSGCGSCGGRGA